MAKVPWPKIVLFGDSLTQRSFDPKCGCWGALLADKFQRICDIIPRGFSGYNSRYCRIIMGPVFDNIPAVEVACVTILLGSNDANEPESPSGQHVPLKEYSQNLRDIIAFLDSKGIRKDRLILMSPPNYFHETFLATSTQPKPPIKSDKRVAEYAKACAVVASQESVAYLDLYRIFSEHPNSAHLFMDGLHFSFAGAELLHQHLQPLVVGKVEQFTKQPLEKLINYPYWADIDPDNAEKNLK